MVAVVGRMISVLPVGGTLNLAVKEKNAMVDWYAAWRSRVFFVEVMSSLAV
jgi:hypothetical protein